MWTASSNLELGNVCANFHSNFCHNSIKSCRWRPYWQDPCCGEAEHQLCGRFALFAKRWGGLHDHRSNKKINKFLFFDTENPHFPLQMRTTTAWSDHINFLLWNHLNLEAALLTHWSCLINYLIFVCFFGSWSHHQSFFTFFLGIHEKFLIFCFNIFF